MKFLHTSAAVLLVALCCAISTFGQTAVRFVHTASGSTPVNVNFGALPLFLNRAPLSASSVRSELPALSYQVQVRDANSPNPLLYSTDMVVTNGISQSFVFAGRGGNYQSLMLAWDQSLPQVGNIKIRFVHAAPSVQEQLTILVGGSLFFQPLSAMSATNFIEVPLAQASSFTYVVTNSNAELAKFTATGKLEAGNVYTVYLAENSTDLEARVVNETSIDDQAPMLSLPRTGVRITVRTINTVNTGAQNWNLNGLPMISSLAPFSASQTVSLYADGSPLMTVHPSDNQSTTLAEQTLNLTSSRFTLVSYGIGSTMKILQLSTTASQPAAGQALVRLAHTAPGVGAVEIIREGTAMIPETAYGTASTFTTMQSQQQTLKVRLAGTQTVLADFLLTPVAGKIYTLLLTVGSSGTEVRLFDESNTGSQSPLPVLNIQSVGTAKLRAVNLIAGRSIRVETDQSIVVDGLGYGHADALLPEFTAGTYIFSARDANAPDVSLASIGSQIANGGNYLLAFLGSQTKSQGVIFSNPKIKVPKDSILVRFVNAAEDIDNLRVVHQTSGELLVDKLPYGDISAYKALPIGGDRVYRLFEGTAQELAILNDNYASHDILTIFIVREGDKVMGYILPDEATEGFRPLPRFEATVGVDEHGGLPGLVSAPWPNPVQGHATVEVSLPFPSELDVRIIDISGRTIEQSAARSYPMGTHRVEVNCSSLTGGLYMAVVRINGRVYSYPLTVVR